MICPICKDGIMAIDFLTKHPNKSGNYMICCVELNKQKNIYERSSCRYWELHENYKCVDKIK